MESIGAFCIRINSSRKVWTIFLCGAFLVGTVGASTSRCCSRQVRNLLPCATVLPQPNYWLSSRRGPPPGSGHGQTVLGHVGEQVVDYSSVPLPQILAEIPMEKEMDEGRKRTLGVIAAILACRKLSVLDGKPSPAREMAFRDSIDLAAEMMRRIWPSSKR